MSVLNYTIDMKGGEKLKKYYTVLSLLWVIGLIQALLFAPLHFIFVYVLYTAFLLIGFFSTYHDRGIDEHSRHTYVSKNQVYQYMILQLKLGVARREIGFIQYWKYRIFKYHGWYEVNKGDLLQDLKVASWEKIKKEYNRGRK